MLQKFAKFSLLYYICNVNQLILFIMNEEREMIFKKIKEIEDRIKASEISSPKDWRELDELREKLLRLPIKATWKIKKLRQSKRVTSFTKDRK